MFALLRSAANYLLGWVFSGGVVKWVLFTALGFILTEVTTLLLGKLNDAGLNNISSTFSSIPANILYFLSVFRLDVGIPIIISAFFVRFFIRRLPIVG